MNWTRIYNRLWELIGPQGVVGYLSGSQFIRLIQEINDGLEDYDEFIAERNRKQLSTSRRDFFKDILLNLEERDRIRAINTILDSLAAVPNEQKDSVRNLLRGEAVAPRAEIAAEVWNAARLNDFLRQIDESIAAGDYARSVTLSYTCLEGFFRAFKNHNFPAEGEITEIIALSRLVQRYLRENYPSYPAEAINMVNHITHTVDRVRNEFSEAHFGEETGRWMAVYVRDLINSQIRQLINFL